VTFEACSGFTRVTARRIAQLPKATFVTRLQPLRLPARAARQLPDQSTTLRVESSSTGNPRLRGALPIRDIKTAGRAATFATDSISPGRQVLGGRVYRTVVPRGAYRGSFVRRFNCTVASTASMRSPPAAIA